MPMTIIVTSNVENRYRGYLTSIMLEVAPGVYIAPRMSAGVRERTWQVMTKWHEALGNGTLLLAWPEKSAPSGVGLKQLGDDQRDILNLDGIYLVSRLVTPETPEAMPPPLA